MRIILQLKIVVKIHFYLLNPIFVKIEIRIQKKWKNTIKKKVDTAIMRLAKELQLSSCTDLWEDLATLTLLLVTFLQEDIK